ncbi:hypothetical protein EP7_005479 [Isosphaeraceae bacterium EP7]
MTIRPWLTASALFALLASGCGGGAGEGAHVAATLPVRGKVTYKGKPLAGGAIRFEPEDSGREAHGEIGPDGTFVLTTFRAGDGAVSGLHRVAVTAPGRGRLPSKYRSPGSSGVSIEVSESESEYLIALK